MDGRSLLCENASDESNDTNLTITRNDDYRTVINAAL